MILHDVSIYGKEESRHIHIEHGKIKAIAGHRQSFSDLAGVRLELEGAVILPGLINAHDHLDFNLFPRLANRIYNNYTEWGKDIHTANSEVIGQVLKIPLALRVRWGLYKNLLNGFTTVVNHGDPLTIVDKLIDVFQDCYSLHSPAFEKNWIRKLNSFSRKNIPFVMHIGEGTDAASVKEISQVIRYNFFGRKIIAVHGVAMTEQQAAAFAGLVWCPASNFFLLNQTAAIDRLKKVANIVFGTDSTLTAGWNAWAHFRQALQTGMVTEDELVRMITSSPASLLKLNDRGVIEENKKADILVIKKTAGIFSLNPEDIQLVIQDGNIKLMDVTLQKQWKPPANGSFSKIRINDKVKWIAGDINGLMNEVKQHYKEVYFPVTVYE